MGLVQHELRSSFIERRGPLPFVFGLGVLVALAMGYSLYVGSHMVVRQAPLINAAMEIQLEAAIGHLWFEEMISGDRHEDIGLAYEHIDRAAWYARAMLEGGENSEGVFLPVRDPLLRQEIEEVQDKILEFRAIALQRWDASEQSGIGSNIDQRFDALFNDFLIQANIVETEIQRYMAKDLLRFRIIQTLLIVLCLTLAAVAGWYFQSYQKNLVSALSAMQRSEEKFRSLYDNAPLSYQSLDETGHFLDINPTWLKTLGYEKEEVIGQDFSEFLHPEWQPHFIENFLEFKKRGYVHDVQFRIRHKEGQYLDISFEGCVGYNPNGSFLQTYCVFQDITERKRSQEQASRFSHILESSLNEIYLFDAESLLFAKVNQGARDNLGFSAEQLNKMTVLDLIPGFDPETFAALVEPLRASEKKTVQFTTEFQRHDGTRYPVDAHLQLMTEFGSPLFAAIILDVTERKQSEKERDRLVKAIEQTNESIVITDAQGLILYTNPVFEQVSGYTFAEVIGRKTNLLKSGEHEPTFYKDLWTKITAGQTWRGRLINKRKDGTFYTEESTISPVFDEDGIIINYVAVKRDVTDQLLMEEQFHQAQKVESIGRLAGGVAHDLNNLLTPILGYAEIIRDEFAPDDTRKADIEIILSSGIRARDLVRQLLAFSRKQTLEYKIVSLNQILVNFESLLRHTIREDITIEILLSPETGNIKADVGQIEQVILNLAVNAADAMPEGGRMTFETGPVQLDDQYASRHHGIIPGKYFMLAVSDNGSGMDDDIQAKIFEPFFSTKGDMGTGLGLATVYGIVKQHGGNIWVYSEVDKGTAFKVFIPSTDDQPSEDIVQNTPVSARNCTETILLAEDNEDVRELATTILSRKGYFVISANNGTDALKAQAEHEGPVHLLLTDVVMPEMNGKQLFDLARTNNPYLKVLFMSGYTDNVIAHQGVLDEDTNFIQKPFTIEALEVKVQAVLERKS